MMDGLELADELLEDWNLKVTAAGIDNIGMAPLPPPPLDFPTREVAIDA